MLTLCLLHRCYAFACWSMASNDCWAMLSSSSVGTIISFTLLPCAWNSPLFPPTSALFCGCQNTWVLAAIGPTDSRLSPQQQSQRR